MKQLIDKILIEWAYRVHDGMPNIKNPMHIIHLRESMETLNLPKKFIFEYIQSLLTEQKFYARNPKGKKISVFTDKENWKDAIKGGYEAVDREEAEKELGTQDKEPETTDVGDSEEKPKPPSKPKITKIEKNPMAKGDDESSDEKNTKITDDLVNGNLDELIKSNNELIAKRALGISGMGGPVASHGEAVFTDSVNTLSNYNELYKEQEEQINRYKQEFKERKKPSFPKPNSEEAEMFEVFGWDKDNPPEEALEYFAKRELFAEKKLAEIKQDENSVFYKKGRMGFNGDEENYKDWMKVSFDGAMATKEEIENNSNIDASKHYTVIQSEDGTDTQDTAVISALEKKLEETDDPHYKRQLDLMKKFDYHDTFAVGQDSEGRTTIYHISNKKASNLTDPHNNTTPAKRIKVMLEAGFSKEISDNVGKALEQGFDDVSDVKQTTVRKVSEVIVSDDLAKLADLLNPKYMKAIDDDKDFVKYREENNIEYGKSKEKLLVIQRYIQSKKADGKQVSYKFGKLFAKMGEEGRKKKVQQANPDINFQDKGVLDSIQIKEDEKSMVKGTYKKIVSTIGDEDKELGFPDEDGNNGPNTQAYTTTVMDSLHINTYIENYDGAVGLTMGGRVAQPNDIRTCLAELSGFSKKKGDVDTPEGRRELQNHLKTKSKIDGEYGGVVTKGPKGEIKLFKDEWRSAGTDSQKVASYFGTDIQRCLKGKIDTRRQEQTGVGK